MWKTEGVMENKLERKFDLVSNPHPHPLIFYRQGKPDGQHILCDRCDQEFLPPAFACSDDTCNFNIHQSCIDLPDEIRSPFHNHDSFSNKHTSLTLTQTNDDPCTCCGQSPYGASYLCSEKCGFAMDVQCAMADPKASGLLKTARGGELRHFSHHHPLVIHHNANRERRVSVPICLVCESPIISTSSYYFCPQFLPQCLSIAFHEECIMLPRQKLYPDLHPEHPLVLLAKNAFGSICACCETECTGFFYSCHACKFNIHVYCVESFNHKHDFCGRLPNTVTFKCTICHISDKAFPWHCRFCNLLAHKECAISKMSQDQLHSSSTQDQDSNLNQFGNRNKDFSHKQHGLTLCRPQEDALCEGCMRYIPAMSQSYGCPPCRFYLHKQCATLQTIYTNITLHWHVLSLCYIPDFMFSCDICLQYFHGFAYRCEECSYVIDVHCAATTLPFKHPSHNHPLTYYEAKNNYKCKACGENLMLKKILGCLECKFYLHIRCARLPLAMINRYDEHPLVLAFENHEEESEETEYYCDVCEEKRNKNKWFYECRICRFAAHIKCIVGDYPFLKSAQLKSHVHPLTLVNECTKKRKCEGCKNSLDGKLALECGNSTCNFGIHAFGQCYHNKLTRGQITFTMPSLRYRSIPLHSDQKWKLTSSMMAKLGLEKDKYSTTLSFLSQGNWHGKHWDDGVYSSIRSLTIYSCYGSMGIEIDYEHEDGIWKVEHGLSNKNVTANGTTTKVTLNHPDEYLTSLHGLYDKNGIHSLSFESNKNTYGPYGVDHIPSRDYEYELIKFPAISTGSKIVGLHGRSIDDENLTAIGFHFIEI